MNPAPQSDIKAWSAKWAANERAKAANMAAFSRLPRDARERAFGLVRERIGSSRVHIEELIEAARELKEMA
jgi:hypothetical protein